VPEEFDVIDVVSIASEKVTTMEVSKLTDVALSAGEVEETVGAVESVSVSVVSSVVDVLSSGALHPVRMIPNKTRQIRNGSNCLMGPQVPNLLKKYMRTSNKNRLDILLLGYWFSN